MNIIVFVKQVPEVSNVEIDPNTNALVREGVSSIINPFDEIGLEEAVRIREKWGGNVTVVSMGPIQAKEALKKCLAMGADNAVLLSSSLFAGSDTLATSFALSESTRIVKLKYDLIFCGSRAIDGDTGQVGPGISEFLCIPLLSNVKKILLSRENDRIQIIAHRETDEGYEVVQSHLPVLVTVIKGLNEPREVTDNAIESVEEERITVVSAKELGNRTSFFGFDGSPTEVVRVFKPKPRKSLTIGPDASAPERIRLIVSGGLGRRKGTSIIEGRPANDASRELVEKLVKDGVF